jgi:hypothetical protein
MKAHRNTLDVLASPIVPALAIIGLVALCMAALDVPQGLADKDVIESWSHGSAGFVSLLGLHHLGSALLPWVLLALVAIHGVAVKLTRAASPKVPLGFADLAASVLLLLALVAFILTGLSSAPPEIRDPTRLTIEPVIDAAPGGRQVVEEGAVYQLPGSDGQRLVAFGVLSTGPWAAERQADGKVRAHLPPNGDAKPASPVSFRVDSRRPLAIPAPSILAGLPSWIPAIFNILASLAAAAALLLAVFYARFQADDDSRKLSAWLALVVLIVLANPLAGPGLGLVPAGSGNTGAPVLYAALARTPLDVSTWVGAIPALVSLEPFKSASLATTIAILLFVSAYAAGPRFAGLSRLVGLAAGALAISGGAILLGYTVGHLPLAETFDSLSARFQQDILPRLPASLTVLEAAPTHDGPYRIPLSFGLLASIGPLVAGSSIILSLRRGTRPRMALLEPLAILLATLAVLRAAAFFLAADPLTTPNAAVPICLISAILAASSVLARRVNVSGKAASIALLITAAVLQFALAA